MDDDNRAAPLRVDTSIDGLHTIDFVHLVHLFSLESFFSCLVNLVLSLKVKIVVYMMAERRLLSS